MTEPQLNLAARVIIRDTSEQILLIRARNLPIWSIPGGKLEANETPEGAAIRETREETGYQIALDGLIGEYWQPQLPWSATTFLYAGHVIGGAPLQQGPETTAVRWFPLGRLPWLLPGARRCFIEQARRATTSPERQPVYFSPVEAALIRGMRQVRSWWR